jgi:hypothetical protein
VFFAIVLNTAAFFLAGGCVTLFDSEFCYGFAAFLEEKTMVECNNTSFVLGLVCLYVTIRAIQRLYYLFKGHSELSPHYSPRIELEKFLLDNSIPVTNHIFNSEIDGTELRYRRLGTGRECILLANGVGTDFFMWLPALKVLINADPLFFQRYTLIVQSYRGLFGPYNNRMSAKGDAVDVTVENCVYDIQSMMKHASK